MKFKLKNIASTVSDQSQADDKTHTLTFIPTVTPAPSATMMVQSSVTLSLTASEAADYHLGSVYELALALVE